jgi:hypothetical protein
VREVREGGRHLRFRLHEELGALAFAVGLVEIVDLRLEESARDEL